MAVSIIDPWSELQQTPGKGSIHHEDPKETVLNSRSTRSRVSTNYSWEGLHAIEALARACCTSKWKRPEKLFLELFECLGKLEGEYTIKLQDEAEPFSLWCLPSPAPMNIWVVPGWVVCCKECHHYCNKNTMAIEKKEKSHPRTALPYT